MKKKIILICFGVILICLGVFLIVNHNNKNSNNTINNSKITYNGKKYNVYELHTLYDDKDIYGEMYMPNADKDKYPTAILSSGFGNNYTILVDYAKNLAMNGIAAYVFDFYAGSPNSKSGGTMLDFTLSGEVKDLTEIVKRIKKVDKVDENNIFLMGESFGAIVSGLVAKNNQKDIQGLIMLYPALVIVRDAQEMFKSVDEIPEKVNALGRTIGGKYYKEILDMDIYEELKGYEKSTLMCYGDSDFLVPDEYYEKAKTIYKNMKSIKVDNADHGFYNEQKEEVIDECIKFILDSMK